ncbi:glycosyl transferase family 1, partial [Pseudomonas syringae]
RRGNRRWRCSGVSGMRSPRPEVATVRAGPLGLHEGRQLARHMTRLVTLTQAGSQSLRQRMGLPAAQMAVINHGNLDIAPMPLPPLNPLRLLYFGFICRGKGIDDLLDALSSVVTAQHALRSTVRLTLAGGSEPEMAFGPSGRYLD